MKILVVTNLYPPHHIGGYELGCRDVVEKLRARGHVVHVLTSRFRNGQTETPPDEREVERTLQFNLDASAPPHDKRLECHHFARSVENFSPDVIYFWNQAGLSFWLPLLARWRGWRRAFFLSDTNFISWRVGAWLAGAARWSSWNRQESPSSVLRTPSPPPGEKDGWKGLASEAGAGNQNRGLLSATIRALFGQTFLVRGWPIVQNQPCHFASEFLRRVAEQNGIHCAPANSGVAHWGIEPAQFPLAPRERWPVRRLLYAGQLVALKGVHTAIAAFAAVAKERGFEELTFSLAGGCMHPDYEQQLRALPAQLGVAGRVRFLGKVPRAELSRIYAEHDVLLFPSEWDEPFAITPLEAIASGLAVVGTTTGGSGELFRNRETAMTFRAGDVADCARALRELAADHGLFEHITRNAQREVREKHTLDAMVDQIEESLKAETGNRKPET